MKSWKNIFIALSIFGCCGCAHLATVKTTQPRVPMVAASEDQLTLAKQYLSAAERAQPIVALGDDLSAAKLSLQVLDQRLHDSSAQSIYNFSVARAVENVERAKIQPWQRKIDIVSDRSDYTLTTPKPIDPEHNPSRYDLFPTDSLKISGRMIRRHKASTTFPSRDQLKTSSGRKFNPGSARSTSSAIIQLTRSRRQSRSMRRMIRADTICFRPIV